MFLLRFLDFFSALYSNLAAKKAEQETIIALNRLDLARARFEVDIKQAEARTAQSEQKIASARKRTAEIEAEAANLRLQLQKAIKEITGRYVSQRQISYILAHASVLRNVEFVIRYSNEDESRNFAISLQTALRTVGAEVVLDEPLPTLYGEGEWYPVTIIPPFRVWNQYDSSNSGIIPPELNKDPVIQLLQLAGIVDSVGMRERTKASDYAYIVEIPLRAARRDGALDRPMSNQ